ILPGYLRIPAPGQKNLDEYVAASAPKKSDPNSWNFFGTNYKNFMVSLLKGWYGSTATASNEYAFDFIPKPAVNSSWMSIFDQALKGKMEGVILSGMTATSIGPDSNQVLQALSNLKWLVIMDSLPTTSSEFWPAPGMDSANLKSDGTTTAGDWIYTGSYTEDGNLSKRRNGIADPQKNDPTGMGFYPQWAWSWPLNRRVMYNRASADLNGKPWDAKRPGIQ